MEVNLEELISIVEMFAVGGSTINADAQLLGDELIDSLNVVQIIAEIEAKFGVKIGAMDLSFDDFESPATLASALKKL